ncbi:probable LRR receptor-like serine/threonine-protein kinase At4g37250 [Andrographis paniculata]|uniref:probable LRR receptor-like serine/threonine-protein kinase At4g37250 n=1 Tax=Andrographis paniculata TaxID=175694 RepID=UPI0021E993BD|nr:probable LRR receptor-like serine/threonine-protein kinase At4g37250 [Andrographis paniculata]
MAAMAVIIIITIIILQLSSSTTSLTEDGVLLLSFKYSSILSDPSSVLLNWDYAAATPCSWTGVACNSNSIVVSLNLSSSNLIGIIPPEYPLSLPPTLTTLDLSSNSFTGTLPAALFNSSSSLRSLYLSRNSFSGHIPVVAAATALQVLDLSHNSLSGNLPPEFGGHSLKYLNLSANNLTGPVPPQFASEFPANATIDLSFNHLSGEIPAGCVLLTSQKSDAYAGNQGLCGKPLKNLCTVPSTPSDHPADDRINGSSSSSPSSSSAAIAAIPNTIAATPDSPGGSNGLKRGAIAGITAVPLAGIGVLAAIALYIYRKRKRETDNAEADMYEYKKDPEAKTVHTWPCLNVTTNREDSSEAATSEDDDGDAKSDDRRGQSVRNERSLVMVDNDGVQLELETLLKASAYVLGTTTGVSIVYRAVLHDGTALAVRRIGETSIVTMKEFESQVKDIAKLRHRNIVRVRGFYWGDDEKLVISDYASNGSLANIAYRKLSSSPYHLPFETRIKIARGVARGLCYIHEKKNVHGNIKPSNILLTPDMDPLISDFGIHWLIHGKRTHKSKCEYNSMTRHFGSYRSIPHDRQVVFMGCTSPYHAPESLEKLKPNPKWDVYSFGILLLEILTGKVFSERELSEWDGNRVDADPSCVVRMVETTAAEGREEAVVAWFKLGLSCASLLPHKRSTIKHALTVLENLA